MAAVGRESRSTFDLDELYLRSEAAVVVVVVVVVQWTCCSPQAKRTAVSSRSSKLLLLLPFPPLNQNWMAERDVNLRHLSYFVQLKRNRKTKK